ncbi:MAG: hypothetical protein ACXWTX_05900 [Gallionella sp.]
MMDLPNNVLTKAVKPRKIYLDGKLLNWDELPKYNGAIGCLGLAKFSDVVEPNHCYYPSICYMDTAFKQYFYDFIVAVKIGRSVWKEASKFEKLCTVIMAVVCVIKLPVVFWVAMFFIIALPFYGAVNVQHTRNIAERGKSLTQEEWIEISVNAHIDNEFAHRTRKMPSWRGQHHISSSGYSSN